LWNIGVADDDHTKMPELRDLVVIDPGRVHEIALRGLSVFIAHKLVRPKTRFVPTDLIFDDFTNPRQFDESHQCIVMLIYIFSGVRTTISPLDLLMDDLSYIQVKSHLATYLELCQTVKDIATTSDTDLEFMVYGEKQAKTPAIVQTIDSVIPIATAQTKELIYQDLLWRREAMRRKYDEELEFLKLWEANQGTTIDFDALKKEAGENATYMWESTQLDCPGQAAEKTKLQEYGCNSFAAWVCKFAIYILFAEVTAKGTKTVCLNRDMQRVINIVKRAQEEGLLDLICKPLVDSGFAVVVDEQGNTLLHHFCIEPNNSDIVDALILNGVQEKTPTKRKEWQTKIIDSNATAKLQRV
jgi:hypothetical protein